MDIYTDSLSYASQLIEENAVWKHLTSSQADKDARLYPLVQCLFGDGVFYRTSSVTWNDWNGVFLMENPSRSLYDLLVEMSRSDVGIPDKIICLAGSSLHCHGQRGRPWVALAGNLHLTVHFAPNRKIQNFGSGFPALAAVSVIQALDDLDFLEKKASIKWVNDIVIDGAKVAGFLAHSQSKLSVVSNAILGIGLNVTRSPDFKPDPFVPKTASLSSFLKKKATCTQKAVLEKLMNRLHDNYALMLSGKAVRLIEFYRERSVVLGRKVRVFSDPLKGEPEMMAAGKVVHIGENLELYLEGVTKPVTRGRLIMEE
jgi:BirA family biotin operon repressor/biotin-[acetyl-CoA-carboxylase] ligase